MLRDGATGSAGRADATFWKRFARHAWEQAPVCLEGAVAPAFVRPDELFAALVRVAGAYRAEARTAQVPGERAVGVRFNVDDAARLIDTGPCLPAAADGSLAGYVARIAGELGDRRLELIVHDVQAYDLVLWRRLRRFLRGLYAEVGVPVDAAEAVVFLRNHEATSFGVHRDEASVFMFPVHERQAAARMAAYPGVRLLHGRLRGSARRRAGAQRRAGQRRLLALEPLARRGVRRSVVGVDQPRHPPAPAARG